MQPLLCSGPQRQVSVQNTRCDQNQNSRRADPPEIRKPASQRSWFAARQTHWLGDGRPLEASLLGGVESPGLVQSKRDEGEYLHTYERK